MYFSHNIVLRQRFGSKSSLRRLEGEGPRPSSVTRTSKPTAFLRENFGDTKLVQLLETSKSTNTLCSCSEVDVQFPEPPNFRVAVNWLSVLLSSIQLQDSVQECQHVQRLKDPRLQAPGWPAECHSLRKCRSKTWIHFANTIAARLLRWETKEASECKKGWFGNRPTWIGNQTTGIKQESNNNISYCLHSVTGTTTSLNKSCHMQQTLQPQFPDVPSLVLKV